MATVTHRYESAQYDGTNSAAILAFLEGASYTVVEASAERLVLTDSEGTRKVVPASGWVIRTGWSHELAWQGSDAAYLAQWTVVAP
jgi:hypothetical protein